MNLFSSRIKNVLLLGCVSCYFSHLHSQTDSLKAKEPEKLKVEGYVEAYYCYDFNKPGSGDRPGFLYNHFRHNEVNVNHAFVRAVYASDNVRGNLALMVGNYAQYNLASEPSLLKNIYEGHVGFKLAKHLWLDAGVFSSHIGWESAVSKDCWTLTRSIVAENSPYYESGAKLNWTPNDKWLISAMYLNGWQHIRRPAGNSTPAFGTQVHYKPNDRLTFNYSTFIGNDKADTAKQMRYYQDFYAVFQPGKKLGVIAGFDFGLEQKAKGSSDYNQWYAPVIIIRYNATDKFSMAVRAEYFQDQKGVIIVTGTPNGFTTKGYSLNLDYHAAHNAVFRLEGKLYDCKDRYFVVGKNLSTQNFCLTTSLAVMF